MATDYSAHFESAARLAEDRDTLRKRFWLKLKQVAAKLPFVEDLLAAYYCAFDKETPRHVQVALLGAIAYFILPFDFIPDMMPVLGFTDDAAILATAHSSICSPTRLPAALRLIAIPCMYPASPSCPCAPRTSGSLH